MDENSRELKPCARCARCSANVKEMYVLVLLTTRMHACLGRDCEVMCSVSNPSTQRSLRAHKCYVRSALQNILHN